MGKIKEWIKTHVVLSIIIVIVVIYGMKLGINFSSAPTFCKMLCHNMEQDVVAWKASFHGSGNNGKPVERHGHKADCHACHYDPGVIGFIKGKMAAMVQVVHEITGERGEPYDELSEEEKAHLLPQYIHPMKKAPTFFTYLHGNKLRITYDACKRCHPDKTRMVESNGLLDVQKDVEKEATAAAPEVKAVTKIRLKEDKFSAVPGPHASHEDKGVICIDCHHEIVHAPKSLGIGPFNLPRMEMCFRECHNGEKAFRDNCEKCHIGQVAMHAGVGAKDVEDSPGYMFEKAECADCGHSERPNPDKEEAKVRPYIYKPDISTCDGCHETGRSDMVKEWHETYEVAVKPVEGLLDEVEKTLKKAGKKHSSDVARAEQLFNDAKYNYDYAVKDRSRGAHNIDYTEAMLKKAKEKLEEARDLLSKKHS